MICDFISEKAKYAGKKICNNRVNGIKKKGQNDYVTNGDKETQDYLIQTLLHTFPKAFIISEEKENNEFPDTMGFIIDPIDGTLNYINGFPHYAISIACVNNKQVECAVVYNPALDELFSAIKGQGAMLNGKRIRSKKTDFRQSLVFVDDGWNGDARVIRKYVAGYRCISSAELAICYVACGKAAGYISQKINVWDFAAGKLIAEESGACLMRVDGGDVELERSNRILAAAPSFEKTLLKICNDGETLL